MAKIKLKDQIVAQLDKTGTLSDADLQGMAAKAPEQEETPAKAAVVPPSEAESRMKVPDAELDEATQQGREPDADETIKDRIIDSVENPDDQFDLSQGDGTDIVITAEDKKRFMDVFVDGSRFTRRFSLCGGKLTGMFRSRKMGESRCLIVEMTRQSEARNLTMMEHSTRIRYALLHCQLAELNGVGRPEWEEPWNAQETVKDSKAEIVPPKWSVDMDIIFDHKHEGYINMLYRELKTFERVYWALVKNAAEQNFWDPEDSTIA